MLNHGWSPDLLKAWQTVSARNHLSQLALRKTYVEGDSIIERRALVQRRMRECSYRRIQNHSAMMKMQRDVDSWTQLLGVGTLSNGEPVHRDQAPRGMSGLVGLQMQGAKFRPMCCHPYCRQDQDLAICSLCLRPRCLEHRFIKAQVLGSSELIINHHTNYGL